MNIECNVEASISPIIGHVELLFPYSYADALSLLHANRHVKKSGQVYVKLSPPKRPRTTGKNSQNAHFNSHVQQIAQYTGDSFDDIKMHLKREAISMGYPCHTDSFGNVTPESEANASTVECSYLIDTAHRVASFLSIVLKEI